MNGARIAEYPDETEFGAKLAANFFTNAGAGECQ